MVIGHGTEEASGLEGEFSLAISELFCLVLSCPSRLDRMEIARQLFGRGGESIGSLLASTVLRRPV